MYNVADGSCPRHVHQWPRLEAEFILDSPAPVFFLAILQRHIQAISISLEHHQTAICCVMILGCTVTLPILGRELRVKECLVVMLVPMFDRRRRREREEDAFFKTEFRVVLNDGLVFG